MSVMFIMLWVWYYNSPTSHPPSPPPWTQQTLPWNSYMKLTSPLVLDFFPNPPHLTPPPPPPQKKKKKLSLKFLLAGESHVWGEGGGFGGRMWRILFATTEHLCIYAIFSFNYLVSLWFLHIVSGRFPPPLLFNHLKKPLLLYTS